MKELRLKLFLFFYAFVFLISNGHAQVTPTDEMEILTRGVVALPNTSGNGYFISWRFFGTDEDNTTFDVLRDGTTIASDLCSATSYNDIGGSSTSQYQIVTKNAGIAVDTSASVAPWDNVYKSIEIDKPTDGIVNGSTYSYTPNDCSVADVDGDGEYELILKWDPSNSKDNAKSGYTGNVIIDCYELDGTKLWRIDLGKNIRAGAHYTQFLVYDFDGDGKAEMICKTAPGSIDGNGNYVTAASNNSEITSADNTATYANSSGRVLNGPEYLTVFNGETGAAINTIFYNPNRAFGVGGSASYNDSWGDSYGNRGDRFLACVAYLDGPDENPSAVMCRGYYTRAYLWAVDFDGNNLTTKWLHASISKSKVNLTNSSGTINSKTYSSNTYEEGNYYNVYGQGAHNLSVGDVDDDGCDEITYGSAAIDNDGSLLYSTGLAHGDAQHLSDLDPDRPGLEFFMVHEDSINTSCKFGCDLRDAKTGEIIFHNNGGSDTGRGMAADIDSNHRGFELWDSDKTRIMDINGDSISPKLPSYDFRIYWDGDLQDELLGDISCHNSPYLEKWDGSSMSRITIDGTQVYNVNSSKTCNWTKGTPCLSGDIFGDWREEMIFWCGTDSCHLNIFTTNKTTNYRFPTLMHDHVYRMGIAWQNVSYNQPPHLGYFLPDAILTRFNLASSGTRTQSITLGDSITPIKCDYVHCTSASISKSVLPDKSVLTSTLPSGFSFADSTALKEWALKAKPETIGDYTCIVTSAGDISGTSINDTILIHVLSEAAIQEAVGNNWVILKNTVFTNQIGLQFNLPNTENIKICMYDTKGSLIYNEIFGIEGSMSLELSGLNNIISKGLYILKIQSKEGLYTKKIIKH